MEQQLISVYKISSDLIDDTYYGYGVETNDHLALFLIDAKRVRDISRGSATWFNKNQNREDNITVEIVDGYMDEYEAWMARNEARASDPHSITGPSVWPNTHFRTASNRNPEKIEGWKKKHELKSYKTAREAYAKLKVFSFKDIKRISEQYGKDAVVADLDSINPYEFSEKYELTINV